MGIIIIVNPTVHMYENFYKPLGREQNPLLILFMF